MIIALALVLWPLPVLTDQEGLDPLNQWAQWRGPLATGVASHSNPPVSWSEDKNLRWKTPIPGLGHSTPIIWGDRIFLTTGIPHGGVLPPESRHAPGAHDNLTASHRLKFVVLAVHRSDGAILWQRTVREERPSEGTHETGSWASNSPVTDGTRLFASFGSRGVYCLDLDGKLLWQTDLGDMRTKHGHGEGSSPVLYGDLLIINWDHEGDSFVIALDKHTGRQRWKVARDEGSSWSTPLVVESGGKPQVIIAATNRVRSYDPATGAPIWECAGLSGNVVASPVAADGMVYVANSYESQNLLAIRLAGAHGDITHTDAVVWTRHRFTPYVPSPLFYGGLLYYLKHYQGFLTCVNARTGDVLFGPKRLPGIGNVFASLTGAADRVYIVSRNGTAVVLQRGTEFQVLARNRLDDSFSASPAIVSNELYLRGEHSLYCIARDPVP